jgi:hypothetical protein
LVEQPREIHLVHTNCPTLAICEVRVCKVRFSNCLIHLVTFWSQKKKKVVKRTWNENHQTILWSPKGNLKFTIGARNYKIALQLAGDLRSICVQKHCVVHGGVTFL